MANEKITEPSLKLEALDKGHKKLVCPFCGHVQYKLSECKRCGAMIAPKKSIKTYLAAIVIFLLTILALSVFIIRDQHGNTIILLDENNHPEFNLPDWSKTTLEAEDWIKDGKDLLGDEVSIHKWQDKNGVWHYSQQAPKESGKTQIIKIDLKTNIIPHHKKQETVK